MTQPVDTEASNTTTLEDAMTSEDKFDPKQQKKFLIEQGWAFTGKFPHRWSDPTIPYDEENFLDIAKAAEVARSRVQMLRATASEKVITRSRVLAILSETRIDFTEAGCTFESGELAAIDRLTKAFREEFRRVK